MNGARVGRQRGFAAVELCVGVALLVLPVAFLVVGLPEWSERQGVARVAARDAARAVALGGWCDANTAEQIVAATAGRSGLGTGDLTLDLECAPGAVLGRATTVAARVTVSMPALRVPLLGDAGAWTWTAVHRTPVDPYGSAP